MEMQTRMTDTLARLVERHRGGVVIAVSHADPIKAALAHALGMHLDLFQRLNVAPGSITTIAYTSGPPMVLGMNSLGDGVPA
jgi:probable phosphoglycerate mutase